MSSHGDLRQDIREIVHRSIAASLPVPGVRAVLSEPALSIQICECKRLVLMAVGKAAITMARAALEWLGEHGRTVDQVLVVAPEGSEDQLPGPAEAGSADFARAEIIFAGHPLPDEASLRAGERAFALADQMGEGDLLLFLLSGGGSALLEVPAAGFTLSDIVQANRELLASGLPIHEMNARRKRLSQIKGGGLLCRVLPARVVQLLLSDVPGDEPSVIASGPCTVAADFAGAVPAADGQVLTRFVGSSRLALDAAVRAASDLGYHPLALTSVLQGEAESAGAFFAAIASEVIRCDRPISRPCAILAAGETVVRLPPHAGRGGRNQHLALSAALGLRGMSNVILASVGTDGRDGPTEAAGGIVDGLTASLVEGAGLDPRILLRDCDANRALSAAHALFVTGPTGTNVNDLIVMLVR